jgi:hypothetical protein
MNDYLTAIATVEQTRGYPRAGWTHRPHPRRRKRILGARIAALLHVSAPRQAAAAAC